MEYHNYNKTPIDRIDEILMKELSELDNVNSCGKKNCRAYENDSVESQKPSCKNQRSDKCDKNVNDHSAESFCDSYKTNCKCKGHSTVTPLSGVPLAMVYSPYQSFDELYEMEEGFKRGTIFKLLDFPFYMESCRGLRNTSCDCGCDRYVGGKR